MTAPRSAALAAALFLVPALAGAGSITGDGFDFTFRGETRTATAGPGYDLWEIFGDDEVQMEWIDGDSVSVSWYSTPGPVTYGFSGLDFLDMGTAVAITGVTFNRAASVLDTFLASATNPTGADPSSFPDPVISFDANGFSVSFSDFGAQLAADGPVLVYDVTTASAVPLPGAAWLLLGGLAALGAARRR